MSATAVLELTPAAPRHRSQHPLRTGGYACRPLCGVGRVKLWAATLAQRGRCAGKLAAAGDSTPAAAPPGLILECDSVLVDTHVDAHRVAFNRAFAVRGCGCGARCGSWLRQPGHHWPLALPMLDKTEARAACNTHTKCCFHWLGVCWHAGARLRVRLLDPWRLLGPAAARRWHWARACGGLL